MICPRYEKVLQYPCHITHRNGYINRYINHINHDRV